MARLVREYRNSLSIAIAHTQTEQLSSPSMTAFTIQWACRNNAISETSEEASGKADCATSAGFIGGILSTQVSHIYKYPISKCPGRHDRCRFRSTRLRCVKRQRQALLCRMEGLSEAEP